MLIIIRGTVVLGSLIRTLLGYYGGNTIKLGGGQDVVTCRYSSTTLRLQQLRRRCEIVLLNQLTAFLFNGLGRGGGGH